MTDTPEAISLVPVGNTELLKWAKAQRLQSPNKSLLLQALAFHSDASGLCQLPPWLLAEHCAMGLHQVQTLLLRLEDQGLLTLEPEDTRLRVTLIDGDDPAPPISLTLRHRDVICLGDPCAAALLSYFKQVTRGGRRGWRRTETQIMTDLYHVFSRLALRAAIGKLISSGYLTVGRDPGRPYDQTRVFYLKRDDEMMRLDSS